MRRVALVALALAACYGGAGAEGDGDTVAADATMVTADDDGSDGDPSGEDDPSGDGDPSGDEGPPVCTAPEVACGQICADVASDPNNCGDCGVSCVIPAAGAACQAGTCTLGACDTGFADCDGELGNGCEQMVACEDGGSCSTSCMSTGALVCGDPCAPICTPPAESCNALDDDCDGLCDQGALAGCRVGIHRAIGGIGHFYTNNAAEIPANGLTTEIENFFWLYGEDTGGLQPLFRCFKGGGRRFLTSSIDCETTGAPELTLGFMSNMQICDSTPLYRSYNATNDDHFYTTSLAEHQNAVAMFGYADQGVTGYVWAGP